jgi:hypothetical protein
LEDLETSTHSAIHKRNTARNLCPLPVMDLHYYRF